MPEGPPDERLEELVAECLRRLPEEGEAAVEEVCRRFPDRAAEIRRHLERLCALGLLLPDGEPAEGKRRVGPYEIVRELGRGGQGTVHLALDTRLSRPVALKLFDPGLAVSGELLSRFRREGEIASRLDHAGICPVYEAGLIDGVHFIAMRYVEGETLAARIARARASARASAGGTQGRRGSSTRRDVNSVLELVEQVARALHAAHERGLIHRDVKPGNIMITGDQQPVLLDFGLARDASDEQPTLTRSGTRMGTPAYMSPEQITGRRQAIDHRTDVYSLGATLYECLTLERPFRAATLEALYHQILTAEPRPVTRLNPQAGRDLRVVIETAMHKEPRGRYLSALAFAEDLRRVREVRPIQARPAGPLLRLGRFAQRNPLVALFSLALFLVLSAGLVVAALLWQKTEAALDLSETRRLILESRNIAPANPGLALLLALEAAKRHESLSARNAVLMNLLACREERTLAGHAELVTSVAFDPAGERLLTTCRDGTARLFDGTTGTLDVLIAPDVSAGSAGSALLCGRFAPDGRSFATAAADGTVRIRDAKTGEPLQSLERHPGPVLDLCFDAAGERIAAACADGTVGLFDAMTGELNARRSDHEGAVLSLAFAPDGRRLVTGSADGSAMVLDVSTGLELFRLGPYGLPVQQVGFSPAGDRILVSTGREHPRQDQVDEVAELWDAATGRFLGKLALPPSVRPAAVSFGAASASFRLATVATDGEVRVIDVDASSAEPLVLRGHARRASCAAFSPDGRRLASGSLDGTARIWNVDIASRFPVLRGHRGPITPVSFSPDGTRLLTAGDDGTARIWNARTGVEEHRLELHDKVCFPARFSADGRRVVTASRDGRAAVWDAVEGRLLRTFDHEAALFMASFSPDGSRVLTSCDDGTARIFETGSGRLLHELPGTRPLWFSRFSPDGRRVATTAEGEAGPRIWNAETGELLHTLDGGADVWNVCWSPDGTRLSSTSYDGTGSLWDAASGRRLAVLEGHQPDVLVFWVAFCPDGSLIATASRDSTARLFDGATGRPLRVLRGHQGDVVRVDFSPDGSKVATSSLDRTARLFDAATGQELLTLPGHEDAVFCTAFHPGGETIATASSNVRLWPIDPIRVAEAMKPRRLLPAELSSVVPNRDP